MVEGLSVIKATTGICRGCVVGKHPEHKFDWGKEIQATCILGMIHSDISGPIPITSMNGSRYLFNFIDEFSRPRGLHLVNLSHSTYDRGILKNILNF